MVDIITTADEGVEVHEQRRADLVVHLIETGVENANIAAIAGSIHARLASMQKDVFQIGHDLLQAKKLLGHGNFRNWIESEFAWSIRTAQNFMNVTSRLGSKSESLAHLGLETLYKLAAPSTPENVVMAVAAKVEEGEKVTSKAVAGMLRKSKPIKATRQRAPARTHAGGNVAPVASNGQDERGLASDDMVEQAFALLKAKLERPRLSRMAYLLARCDVVHLVARLEKHLAATTKRDGDQDHGQQPSLSARANT